MLEVYNSKLISLYSRQDARFHQLAIVLKLWNKNHFNDPTKRLNSYSLTLMLIAHLMKSKILPNLQKDVEDNSKMIRFHKYFFNSKAFDFGVHIEENIFFETDINLYQSFRENSTN